MCSLVEVPLQKGSIILSSRPKLKLTLNTHLDVSVKARPKGGFPLLRDSYVLTHVNNTEVMYKV